MRYLKLISFIIVLWTAALAALPTQATAAGLFACTIDTIGKSCIDERYICMRQNGGSPECECRWGYFDAIHNLYGFGGIDNICEFIDSFSGSSETTIIISILNKIVALMVALVVFTAMISMVIGGYIYMTAGGSADRVQQAKVWIVAALLGITIALSAWMILNLINPNILYSPY